MVAFLLMKFAAAVFFMAWVAVAQPPAPESVLGHRPGDDFFLATYDESLAYFHEAWRRDRSASRATGGDR